MTKAIIPPHVAELLRHPNGMAMKTQKVRKYQTDAFATIHPELGEEPTIAWTGDPGARVKCALNDTNQVLTAWELGEEGLKLSFLQTSPALEDKASAVMNGANNLEEDGVPNEFIDDFIDDEKGELFGKNTRRYLAEGKFSICLQHSDDRYEVITGDAKGVTAYRIEQFWLTEAVRYDRSTKAVSVTPYG